ncbi:hypothetical protein BH11MYX4_BH11MYX4_29870 [soil metagenome]
MGYDLLAAVFFVLLTPVVLVAFVIFWVVNARDHEELASAWRRYARTRGLDFVAPDGEWPNRSAPAITWTSDDATLRLTTVGREAKVRTRLTVRPRATLLGSLVWICEDGAAARIRRAERPAGFAQRIVGERVQRALLALRQRDRVTLCCRRGRVTVEWPGGELNDARLDEARRVGEEIARSVDEEFRRPALVRKPAA